MDYLFYYIWNDIRILNIYNEIELFKPKKIIFFAAEEYSLLLFSKDYINEFILLEKIILKYDIKIIIIFGSKKCNDFYNKINNMPITKNIELIFWPMYWLYATKYQIDNNDIAKYYYDKYNDKFIIDKLFISLNNRTTSHRCKIMDELFNNKLFDYGYLSWIKIEDCSKDWNWKYWNPIKLELDDYDTPNGDQFTSTPIEYKKVLFNLINETTVDVPFLTEKTFKSILLGEPFIIFGAPKIHKLLVDYGFELYDELFDYTFDEIEDVDNRINGIIVNMLRLKDKNYIELRKMIKLKINRNRDKALNILKSKLYIPDIIIDLVNKYELEMIKLGIPYGDFIK